MRLAFLGHVWTTSHLITYGTYNVHYIHWCDLDIIILRMWQEDYMSLEVINGKVVYKFDLGTGIGIIENPAVVNDGEWHEVVVERWVV